MKGESYLPPTIHDLPMEVIREIAIHIHPLKLLMLSKIFSNIPSWLPQDTTFSLSNLINVFHLSHPESRIHHPQDSLHVISVRTWRKLGPNFYMAFMLFASPSASSRSSMFSTWTHSFMKPTDIAAKKSSWSLSALDRQFLQASFQLFLSTPRALKTFLHQHPHPPGRTTTTGAFLRSCRLNHASTVTNMLQDHASECDLDIAGGFLNACQGGADNVIKVLAGFVDLETGKRGSILASRSKRHRTLLEILKWFPFGEESMEESERLEWGSQLVLAACMPEPPGSNFVKTYPTAPLSMLETVLETVPSITPKMYAECLLATHRRSFVDRLDAQYLHKAFTDAMDLPMTLSVLKCLLLRSRTARTQRQRDRSRHFAGKLIGRMDAAGWFRSASFSDCYGIMSEVVRAVTEWGPKVAYRRWETTRLIKMVGGVGSWVGRAVLARSVWDHWRNVGEVERVLGVVVLRYLKGGEWREEVGVEFLEMVFGNDHGLDGQNGSGERKALVATRQEMARTWYRKHLSK
ncbi:hypothetical protein HDU97_007068 [Phlyctochytrium planicorne]|nr:hypothetical protein HDU97_007068 [Phlyctochytrium planicorne]